MMVDFQGFHTPNPMGMESHQCVRFVAARKLGTAGKMLRKSREKNNPPFGWYQLPPGRNVESRLQVILPVSQHGDVKHDYHDSFVHRTFLSTTGINMVSMLVLGGVMMFQKWFELYSLKGFDEGTLEDEQLTLCVYIYIPDAPCMDYLPTLGAKWPHSRGNVGKYSLHGASGYIYIYVYMNIDTPAYKGFGVLGPWAAAAMTAHGENDLTGLTAQDGGLPGGNNPGQGQGGGTPQQPPATTPGNRSGSSSSTPELYSA